MESADEVVPIVASRHTIRCSLNDGIERIGSGKFQFLMGLICGLTEWADGVQQLSVSFLLHDLGKVFALSNQGKALIATVAGGGMLVGALFWGRMADIRGRKFAFFGTLFMASVFAFLNAAAPTFASFLVLRFLMSIGIGGNVPLAFTVFSEFCPKNNRGSYLTLLEAFWSVGAVSSCAMAWAILPSIGWRYYVILCAVPSFVLSLVALWLLPESPRFHLISGDVAKAEQTLHSIARTNGRASCQAIKLHKSAGEFVEGESSVKQLFHPSLRRSTVLILLLYFLLAFGCGVFVWMPVLLEFKKLEIMSMYRSMVIMAFSQVPGVIMAAYLIEEAGRKKAIALYFFFGAVFTSVFAVSTKESIIVTATILMEFFLAGSNGVLSAYTVEVFPTPLRSTAMGVASSMSRLSAVISPTIWASFLDINVELAIFIGAGSLVIGLLMSWTLPLETKGTDLADHVKTS